MMPGPQGINPLLLVVLAVAVGIALIKAILPRRTRQSYSFIKAPVMSAAEVKFFRSLGRAFPEMLIFPQVSMGALLKPKYENADRRHLPAFRSVSQKRVDFVICNEFDITVVCLVELDDRTHDPAKDRERDRITSEAGYRTVRVRSAKSYDLGKLAEAIGRPGSIRAAAE